MYKFKIWDMLLTADDDVLLIIDKTPNSYRMVIIDQLYWMPAQKLHDLVMNGEIEEFTNIAPHDSEYTNDVYEWDSWIADAYTIENLADEEEVI